MTRWTDETDHEADEFFPTLTEAEIRRRQDLCRQQQALNYQEAERQGFPHAGRVVDTTHDLQRMDDALTKEMLRRCGLRTA